AAVSRDGLRPGRHAGRPGPGRAGPVRLQLAGPRRGGQGAHRRDAPRGRPGGDGGREMSPGSLASMGVGYCALVARSLARLPKRGVLRRRYGGLLGVGGTTLPIAEGEVAVLIRIKNEDFWIEPILRVVCKVFDEIVVIDTGSQDRTLSILDALTAEGVN